jgi:hypothetical protein
MEASNRKCKIIGLLPSSLPLYANSAFTVTLWNGKQRIVKETKVDKKFPQSNAVQHKV